MNWYINKSVFQIALLIAAVAGTLNPRSYNKNRFWDQKQDYALQTNDNGKHSNFASIISSKSQFFHLEPAICFTILFYHDKF